MPVDTGSKRASAVQILAPWLLAPVLPDGTLDQGDRQHIAWCYSGILASSVFISAVRILTLPAREFNLKLDMHPIELELSEREFALELAARAFGLELPARGFDLRLPS